MPRGEYGLWTSVGTDDNWTSVGTVPAYHFARPANISNPLDVDFGGFIVLRGFDISSTKPAPGDTATLRLYWQAVHAAPRSYTTFVHLVDPAGNLAAQSDVLPGNGQWPTNTWMEGELVTDMVVLTLPSSSLPGEYRLLVGWYDWQTGERLPLLSGAGDSYVLARLNLR
jgi:hypothetical protein